MVAGKATKTVALPAMAPGPTVRAPVFYPTGSPRWVTAWGHPAKGQDLDSTCQCNSVVRFQGQAAVASQLLLPASKLNPSLNLTAPHPMFVGHFDSVNVELPMIPQFPKDNPKTFQY